MAHLLPPIRLGRFDQLAPRCRQIPPDAALPERLAANHHQSALLRRYQLDLLPCLKIRQSMCCAFRLSDPHTTKDDVNAPLRNIVR